MIGACVGELVLGCTYDSFLDGDRHSESHRRLYWNARTIPSVKDKKKGKTIKSALMKNKIT